jgi:hypothetical protein
MANFEAFFKEHGCDKTGRPQTTAVPPPSKPVKNSSNKPGFFSRIVAAFSGDKAKPAPTTSASPPRNSFAHGGGSSAIAGGGVAVPARHSATSCRHAVCLHLKNTNAGHGVILVISFIYYCKVGPTKSVIIMVNEKGSWNLPCETMEKKDLGCWLATLERAIREECKIFLSTHLSDSHITLGTSIGKTPVFYVHLNTDMVKHNLSRGILNAQVAADNRNPILPRCYKEIQAIGFFEKQGTKLVPLDGNPVGYPNKFSDVANSWRMS